jgi:V/A-type H+/Na+-transporting ATPase subunit K
MIQPILGSMFDSFSALYTTAIPAVEGLQLNMNHFLAFFGLGMLGLGLSGSAIGLAIAGSAVAGMREEKRGLGLAVSVLPGTQGLYSFVVGILLVKSIDGKFSEIPPEAFLKVFAAGTVTGLACLFSGWFQGVVCAAGIKSVNQDKMGVGTAFLLAVLPEFYAILAFVLAVMWKP